MTATEESVRSPTVREGNLQFLFIFGARGNVAGLP